MVEQEVAHGLGDTGNMPRASNEPNETVSGHYWALIPVQIPNKGLERKSPCG